MKTIQMQRMLDSARRNIEHNKKKAEKVTQLQIVENRLNRYGQVNNLWAMNNGIWRLSHVILLLREQGLKIEGEYLPSADGGQSKIYNYKLNNK